MEPTQCEVGGEGGPTVVSGSQDQSNTSVPVSLMITKNKIIKLKKMDV